MHVSDYFENPTWRTLYVLAQKGYFAGKGDDNRYSKQNYNEGGYSPLFIMANDRYTVQLNRHNSQSPYDSGIIYKGPGSTRHHEKLETCVDSRNNPYLCARTILDTPPPTNTNYGYGW
jgi:hypothetical protein